MIFGIICNGYVYRSGGVDGNMKRRRLRKFTKKQVAHALQLLEVNSYAQVEEITGISKSILIRAKREVAKGGR